MIKGLEAFLTVDSTLLLGEGGATNIFVVGGGVASTEDREIGVFVFVFEVKVDS